MFLEQAFVVAKRSTCSRLAVGAVLVKGTHHVGQGYNGAPAGIEHCSHEDDEPCRLAVHAEANALLYATVPTPGCALYVTHNPCYDCSKLIINAGISRVVYGNEYRSDAGLLLLQDAGILTAQIEH